LITFDSPWGKGYPGWHIECSAMSMSAFGERFDLHTGGEDNVFPHHEDEIAQSEGAVGHQVVAHWVHGAHLLSEGRKMAKSAQNAQRCSFDGTVSSASISAGTLDRRSTCRRWCSN